MATPAQVTGAAILFAFYAITILFFVIRGSRKTKSINDYALGSVSFSPFFVGLSLASSMTSAATFVINPGLVANFGISGYLSFGIVFPLASMLSLVVMTKSFRKYGQSVKAVSLASWIRSRYESKGYGLFVALLSFLLIAFIVLILVALAKVMSQALNADQVLVLGVLTVFIFGYMMFGGANSMVYTNMVQALVMIVVAFILITSGVKFFNEGLGGFFDQLRSIDPLLTSGTNPESPLFRNYIEIIIAQLIVGIAVVVQPHIITKSLLLKEEKDVNTFLVTAVGIQLLFYTVVIAGLYARLTFPDLTANGVTLNNDSIIPTYVMHAFSGGIFAVLAGLLVILGLISAGFSTVEGLIQSLSTTLTTDLIKPLFGKQIKNEKNYLLINKGVIIFLAILSFFIARDQLLHPKLSVAIFAQNGVYAYFSILFVPILFGIFIKKISLKVPLTASLVALVSYYSVYYLFPYLLQKGLVDFGYFNIFLKDSVQNPAIAAATAILLSLTAGFTLFFIAHKKKS